MRPRRGCHRLGERADVVFAEAARRFGVGGVLVRSDDPHRCHRHAVNATHLVHADEAVGAPLVGFESLAVHPPRRIPLALFSANELNASTSRTGQRSAGTAGRRNIPGVGELDDATLTQVCTALSDALGC